MNRSAASPLPAPDGRRAARAPDAPMRILLAEADAEMRRLLTLVLQNAGIRIRRYRLDMPVQLRNCNGQRIHLNNDSGRLLIDSRLLRIQAAGSVGNMPRESRSRRKHFLPQRIVGGIRFKSGKRIEETGNIAADIAGTCARRS